MKIEKLFTRESTNETELDLNLYYDKELKKLIYKDRYGIRVEVGTGPGGSSVSTDTNKILDTNIEPGNINSSVKYLYREGTFLKYNIETEIE